MIKSRSVFIALLTFSIGSLFVYLFYLNSQKSTQEKTEIQPTLPISQETKTEKTKVFDKNGEEVFWQGTSEDFNIRWTDKDIYIEKNGKTQKLFSKYADYIYRKNDLASLKMYCSTSIQGSILSIVGSIMTIQINDSTFCVPSAHPSDEPQWIIVDLNKLNDAKFDKNFGNSLKLTDIFSDKEVLEAMLENEEVTSAINEIDKNYKPKTVIELAHWFRRKEDLLMGSANTVNYGIEAVTFNVKGRLEKNSFYDFSFERIEGDYVFIDIGLQPIGRKSDLPALSLKLKIPDKLRQNLELANSRQQGFLSNQNFGSYPYSIKEFEIGLKYKRENY